MQVISSNTLKPRIGLGDFFRKIATATVTALTPRTDDDLPPEIQALMAAQAYYFGCR